jgi:hypothetical protein
MSGGVNVVLAVCGGGGSNTASLIVIGLLFAVWLWVIGLIISRAPTPAQRLTLVVLLPIAVALGAAGFFASDDILGGDRLARFVISLFLSGFLGWAVAHSWPERDIPRAIVVALAGNVLIPIGIFVVFFSSLLIGSSCLD